MQDLVVGVGDWIEIISDEWYDLAKIYIVIRVVEQRDTNINMDLTDSLQSFIITRNVPKNQIRIVKKYNVSFQR